MKSPMLRPPGRNGLGRRVAAMTAGLVLATTAAVAPAAKAGSGQQASTPVSDSQVLSALKIGPVPSELVFLIDLSESMNDGSLKQVRTLLPEYFSSLPAYDRVTVITFSDPRTQAATVVYGPDVPTTNIDDYLPTRAAGGTDFGYAFSKALDQFKPGQIPAGVKAAGVVLLSDGVLNASTDSKYNGYGAAGWAALKTRATHISETVVPLTGFAVPLKNGDYPQKQETALSHVFDNVDPLSGASGISDKLAQVAAGVEDGEVAEAVRGDSGKGIQVSWSGLPTGQLDLSKGNSVPAELSLSALTSTVPLSLTGLRVTADGLPLKVSQPPGGVTLMPGAAPQPYPVTLSWSGGSGCCRLFSSSTSLSGHLTLHATVGSPWSGALLDFNDTAFSVGLIHGGTSPQLTARQQVIGIWWEILFGVLLLLALGLFFRHLLRLRGTLVLTSVDNPFHPGQFPLQGGLRTKTETDSLVGTPGKMVVRRSLRKGMKVTVTLPKSKGTVTLRPGGRAIAGGVNIEHVGGE